MDHLSSKITYDLTIAYRIYPNVSKTPFIHKHDKLKLAETGVRTLKRSLGKLRSKIFFILDNCPIEYEVMILKYFNQTDVEFIKTKGIGNLATFSLQIDLLLKQSYSETVCFAEDDYVYRPELFGVAVNFLNESQKVDFISLYDSLDCYTFPIHTRHKYEIRIFGGLHWRTSASSCLTFITKKSVLKKTEGILRSYTRGAWDSSIWFALTKTNVFNWISLIDYAIHDVILFKAVLLSWQKLWFQILLGRKYQLWQPIPSIATHMEERYLAPNVDWMDIVSKEEIIQTDN